MWNYLSCGSRLYLFGGIRYELIRMLMREIRRNMLKWVLDFVIISGRLRFWQTTILLKDFTGRAVSFIE